MIGLFPDRRERLRRQAARWLARLLDEPNEADLRAFRRWHDADVEHAEAFARASAGYDASEILRRSARFGSARSGPRVSSPWRPTGYALAASLAALTILGALAVSQWSPSAPAPEPRVLAFSTGIGEIRAITLPDGTQVTLDTASSVHVELLRDLRHVTLDTGRARFDVAQDDARPFVVEAGVYRIAGKSMFDVSIGENGAIVRSLEGIVSVEANVPVSGVEPVRLAAGETVRVLRNGQLTLPARNAGRGVLWPSGRLEFDNVPLGTVLAEANRYASTQVSVGDPALSRLRLTGTFRAGDVDGLARGAAEALGLVLERKPGGQLVLHPGRD